MPEISHKRQRGFYFWALILKLSLFFPPLAVCSVLGNGNYGWPDFGIDAAVLTGSLLLALLGSRFLAWYEKGHPRKVVELDREVLRQARQTRFDAVVWITLLIYFISAAFLLILSCLIRGWLTGILVGIVLFVCWIRVFRSAEKDYTGLVSLLEYLVSGFSYLFFLAFFSLLHSVFGLEFVCQTEPLLLVFALYTVSMGFLINQANLDRTMESMKHSKASLPHKIRRYNALIVSGVIALLLVGFLFRSQIAGFLTWITDTVVYALLVGIAWLAKLLTIGPSGSESEERAEAGAVPEGSLPQAEGNPYYDLILLFLLVGMIAFLISPPGRRLLKKAARIPKQAFQALLHLISPKARMEPEALEFYTDFVEDLSETAEEKAVEEKNSRQFKKRLKEWRKLTKPEEKVRFGYCLTRDYTGFQGVEITSADTVKEAEKKADIKPYAEIFSKNGILYERVRYAGQEPSTDELDRFSENVEKILTSE